MKKIKIIVNNNLSNKRFYWRGYIMNDSYDVTYSILNNENLALDIKIKMEKEIAIMHITIYSLYKIKTNFKKFIEYLKMNYNFISIIIYLVSGEHFGKFILRYLGFKKRVVLSDILKIKEKKSNYIIVQKI